MKKIAFLGCENYHTLQFLEFIRDNEKYSDIEVLGVYSHDALASQNLADKFGVKILSRFDECVDEADGVVITARHGDKHLEYALPYMNKPITIFMDKPITISEDEAVKFINLARENSIKISGGSTLRYDAWVQELAKYQKEQLDGETIGGYVRCPISMGNPNGGFFFYAQHLVETVLTIFGFYPNSVHARKIGTNVSVQFNYESFQVTGLFVDEVYTPYYAMRMAKNGVQGSTFIVNGTNPSFAKEFDEFYEVLSGAEQVANDKNFISSVFVMNAIYRSLESEKEEKVNEIVF